MRAKLLSLLLVITLLAVTISVGLPTILAADENLITNGDFTDYSGGKPTGWNTSFAAESGATIQVVEDVQITDSLKANAVKITTSGTYKSTNGFTYGGTIKIEKNASYTMTYWVKVSKIAGIRTYMFEPNYIDKNGTPQTKNQAAEGQNIYSYTYDNGTTRVIRKDVQHSWKIAETGTMIDNSTVSMFISRSGGTEQVLTPDYPNASREGEWLQVIHTFSTGNDANHEANVAYDFRFPAVPGGELWIADVKMSVVKSEIDDYYTPTVNDVTLGTVSADVPLYQGAPSEITATPFGENKFDGWFVDGELVSTDATLTFTFDAANPPKYEARFTKATFGIDGSFESGYTNNQLLAQVTNLRAPSDADTDWTPTVFLTSERNNSGFYVDSHYSGTWRKASITNADAHTGKYSVLFSGQYGMIGYKYTGLTPNSDYTLSVYAKLTADPTNDWAGVGTMLVTPANETCLIQRSATSYGPNNVSALAYKYSKDAWDVTKGWTKLEIDVNTKNNTEIIFWIDSNGTNAKLYLDNFSIKRPPQTFQPKVNDAGLGKATSETTDVFTGSEVTVTAESVNGGVFKGWFIGDELVSSEITYTFTYEERFNDITAKFEVGPTTLPDYSFENSYTNGQLLAESPNVDYNNSTNSTLWTDDLFKTSSKDGNNKFFIDSDWAKWGKVIATTEQAHTGSFSIKMSPNSRSVGYKLEGLDKDTNYTISFYAMTTGTSDSTTSTVGGIAVTDANMSCIIKNPNGTLSQRTDATGALARTTGSDIDCRESWKKFSVRFNSKDSTDVIVWVRPEGVETKLYIDDLTLAFSPKEFKPQSNNSGLGSVTPTDYIECSVGQSITVTATPYPDALFEGWYVADELISKDATFTFNYEDKYQGLTAVFAGVPGTIPNGSFEYYQNGQVLASFNPNNTPQFQMNPPWTIDDQYKNLSFNLTVNNERAHTGEKSAVINVPYRYTGLDIEGLQPSTEYMISFWAYITGAEPTLPTHDQNPKNVSSAFVVKKGQKALVTNSAGSLSAVGKDLRLGDLEAQVDCYNKWSKVDVIFTTPADTGDVTLFINFSGQSAKLYLDDFTIGFGVKANYSAELGGEITANFNSKYVLKGSEVTLEAIPFEGNTFTGWYDLRGTLVSSDAKYTFTAEEAFDLIAKFDGYNKPATDLFALGGKDGTFENGTVPGWIFDDPTYDSPWCSASVSSKVVYQGEKSLEINGRYRNSILPLTGLTPNSDYRLSFYVNQPDTNEKAKVDSIAIIGSEFTHLGTANVVFNQIKPIKSNSGWYKIDLYFNTGEHNSANLIIRFSAETLDNLSDRLYIDNLSLYSYEAEDAIVNGGFDDGKSNWIGSGKVVTDADNNVLSLDANESIYQDMAVEPFTYYTVSFKAKGKLTAAAQDLSKFDIDIKNFISSESYIEVDGTEWTKYTYNVYSGIHEDMNFVFKAGENGTMIDDFNVVKNPENAGAVLEHIDFETDRFDLSIANKNSAFSIYNATSTNDPNVSSGNKSLKFTYNPALADTALIFDETWLSYQTGIGNNFKITMKYKVVGGKSGGAINLAPEYSGDYGADTGLEHMAMDDGWNTVNFYVNNMNYGALKIKIASVLGVTSADFYVDDIVISVAPPMVSEENAKVTYCEQLYNAIDNESFEKPATDKDWKDLPATAKIVKGDALKGSYFLRASKGTKYVLQVEVKPNTEYYFAASVRGTANTVGSIGITIDSEGTIYYANRDEVPSSMVDFDAKETGWKRKGFKFVTTGSDKANICINVTSGYLDIDSVMLFTSDYGYRYDPNDYTVYVPYDYDNLKSETTVYNGGFGKQPYYTGKIDSDDNGLIDGDLDGDGISDDIVLDESELEDNTDDSTTEDGSPSTGDTRTMPIMITILAAVAGMALMFVTKRKEGAENA